MEENMNAESKFTETIHDLVKELEGEGQQFADACAIVVTVMPDGRVAFNTVCAPELDAASTSAARAFIDTMFPPENIGQYL